MGLAERHAYRFGYLQSEHWKCLRAEKLAKEDARCFYCGHRDISNDVHHIYYPRNLYTVHPGMLRVLCRAHHKRMHELIDELRKTEKFANHHDNEAKSFELYVEASEVIEKEIVNSGGKRATFRGTKVQNDGHLRRHLLRGGWVGDSSHKMLQSLFGRMVKTEEHFEKYSELTPVRLKLTEAVLEMDRIMREKGLEGLPEMRGYSASPDGDDK